VFNRESTSSHRATKTWQDDAIGADVSVPSRQIRLLQQPVGAMGDETEQVCMRNVDPKTIKSHEGRSARHVTGVTPPDRDEDNLSEKGRRRRRGRSY
jgi:hypothetical protein